MKKEDRCRLRACTSSCFPCSTSAWLVSVGMHLAVPFLLGALFFEGSKYAVASSTSAGIQSAVAVELVASAPFEPAEDHSIEQNIPVILPQAVENVFIKTVEAQPKPKKILPPPRRVAHAPKKPEVLRNDEVRQPQQVTTLAAGDISARSSLGDSTTSASPDYLRNPPPPYPRESRYNREEGIVLLSVSLDGSGAVQNISLKESSRFARLDEAAIRAVRNWKFKPAKVAGIGVSTSILVPVRFVLR